LGLEIRLQTIWNIGGSFEEIEVSFNNMRWIIRFLLTNLLTHKLMPLMKGFLRFWTYIWILEMKIMLPILIDLNWVKLAMRKFRFEKLTMEVPQKISTALKREEDKNYYWIKNSKLMENTHFSSIILWEILLHKLYSPTYLWESSVTLMENTHFS
jgi:hypothetical protein